ncbi:MAG: hypothetical protein M3461_09615 [Pseudomonadota bacterium]|nr:hypothetical protein [Pseudomonadota bacterium]
MKHETLTGNGARLLLIDIDRSLVVCVPIVDSGQYANDDAQRCGGTGRCPGNIHDDQRLVRKGYFTLSIRFNRPVKPVLSESVYARVACHQD